MSLVRAFTTRGKRSPESNISAPMGRAASHRNGKPVLRNQISSPVALVSTTNMLSYSAPDINGHSSNNYRDFSASTASSTSGEDSDASTNHSIHSNDTTTDMSSIDESPICAPNHLSSYFKPAIDTTNNSPVHSPSLSASASFEAPVLPQRAPSHSKHAHETISRKRSVQRLQSPPVSARASSEIPSRAASVEAPRENPFGKELEQLDEIAEEFGQTVRNAEHDADTAYMRSRNLGAYAASDYLNEIHSLIADLYEEPRETAAWF